MTSGLAAAIQIWTIAKGGPVFASIYLPLQTLLVALMASIILGEEFFLGGCVCIIQAALISFCSLKNFQMAKYVIHFKGGQNFRLDYHSFVNMLSIAYGLCYRNLIVFNFEVQDYWSFINYIRLVPCCLGKK